MSSVSNPRSAFFQDVQSCYGSFIGPDVARSAEKKLRSWGLDPEKLVPATERGNNMRLYKYGDSLLVKIGSELERHQQMPLPAMAPVLSSLASGIAGYDMGSVAISVSVVPRLNTKDVTPAHVEALCHELYTKHGVLFRDNKLENVGLTQDGTPYVIDDGSLIRITDLPRGEKPFLYPEYSGFNAAGTQWGEGAKSHSFTWPAQKDVPQFAEAAALLGGASPLAIG